MLERRDDMICTGTRHPFLGIYKVAVDRRTKKISALKLDLISNGGYSLGISFFVMAEKAMASVDSMYDFGEVLITG